MTDAPHDEAAGPAGGERPPQEMRLRSRRAPVTRLSRRVLIGSWRRRSDRRQRRAVLRLAAASADNRLGTLQHRQPQHAGRPRQSAERLYGAATPRSAARTAAARRSRPADPQRRRAGAGDRAPIRSSSASPKSRRRPSPAISSPRPMSVKSPRRRFRRRRPPKPPRRRRRPPRAISPPRTTSSLS